MASAGLWQPLRPFPLLSFPLSLSRPLPLFSSPSSSDSIFYTGTVLVCRWYCLACPEPSGLANLAPRYGERFPRVQYSHYNNYVATTPMPPSPLPSLLPTPALVMTPYASGSMRSSRPPTLISASSSSPSSPSFSASTSLALSPPSLPTPTSPSSPASRPSFWPPTPPRPRSALANLSLSSSRASPSPPSTTLFAPSLPRQAPLASAAEETFADDRGG